MFLGIFIKCAPSWSLWSTLLVGFSASVLLQFVLTDDLMNRLWGSGHSPLNKQELADLKIAVITGVMLVVCVGWFLICTAIGRETPERRQRPRRSPPR